MVREYRLAGRATLQTKNECFRYKMNRSGKYNEYHEQLKYSVIRIVREKYLKTTNFTSDEEFKTFLEVLYVFLVKEMHKSLNQVSVYVSSRHPLTRTGASVDQTPSADP